MYDKELFGSTVKQIFWDYNYNIDQLFDILTGINPGNDWVNRDYILRRMFERLGWYEILMILGEETIKLILDDNFIRSFKDTELRRRYEFVQQVLQGETLSLPGWNSAYRERLQNSLLSHRRNYFE